MNHGDIEHLFMEHSGIVGYISDMETYDLLYMTSGALKLYCVADTEEYRGEKCYRLLHGLDAPCPFCPNDKMTFDYKYRWNHYNDKIGRWLGSTNQLLMLDGRRCCLQISKDITARKKSEGLSAADNVTMEDVLYHCMNILAEEDNPSVAMKRTLEAIGAYYRSDGVCIFEVNAERGILKKSFECFHSDTVSDIDCYLEMDFDAFSEWLPVLEKGLPVVVESAGEPDFGLHRFLNERNISSFILAPLLKNGQLAGILTVENPHVKTHNMELLQSVPGFILEELQRRYLSEQLDFAESQSDIQHLLDFIRKKLDVDISYVLEALTNGRGLVFTHMSVSDSRYNLVGLEQHPGAEDCNRLASMYDKDGLCDHNPDWADKKSDTSVLHYGVFLDGEYNGAIGVIDYRCPERKWTDTERAIIRKAGQSISGYILNSRLKKVNEELDRSEKTLKQTAAVLRQERQMYRDALLHDCDYAYIVNVSKNKIEDVYKGGFLEKYSFSVDRPYDEAMSLVVEKMKPVILHGIDEFHLTSHYIKAYEQGKRMVEVEYYVPDSGAYKRKSLFFSKDEFETLYVFVVTHDITARRCEELETEKSLTQLAEVAKEVGRGNLDVVIDLGAPGLVGVLADVLNQTIVHLKQSMDKLNQQATQDPMTGVKNKRVWQDAERRLDAEIGAGTAAFAVVVCDVNNLKRVNDSMGHEAGDRLILRASRHICRTFVHSPVYRIGGDEFTVILEGTDLADCERLLTSFYADMPQARENPGEAPVSIALGISHYVQGDTAFSDVFHRADEAMYLKKSVMKAGR